MLISARRGHTATRCPFQKAELEQVRFHHIHDRIRLLADGCRDGFQTDRATTEFGGDAVEDATVEIIQTISGHDGFLVESEPLGRFIRRALDS